MVITLVSSYFCNSNDAMNNDDKNNSRRLSKLIWLKSSLHISLHELSYLVTMKQSMNQLLWRYFRCSPELFETHHIFVTDCIQTPKNVFNSAESAAEMLFLQDPYLSDLDGLHRQQIYYAGTFRTTLGPSGSVIPLASIV